MRCEAQDVPRVWHRQVMDDTWRATQADCKEAARPNRPGKWGTLFLATSLACSGQLF